MSRLLRSNVLSLSLMVALAATANARTTAADMLVQMQGMPEEFRDSLFGAPLAVRVMVNGAFLGDAQMLLSEAGQIQLLAFDDSPQSDLPASDRQRWLAALSAPTSLGRCSDACANGLLGVHYSLEDSQLTLSTRADDSAAQARHLALPDHGSRGLVVRSSLALSGGQQQPTALGYSAALHGSIGRWSTTGTYQYYRSDTAGDANGHALEALFAQRELGDHFMRAGLFRPVAEAGIRQPLAAAASAPTLLGMMVGSSDALLNDNGSPSLYPVYVTASADGIVEIYRDGRLLTSQRVATGVQEIDTRGLPAGIYDIELRVVDNGHVRSRERAVVHKPGQWRDLTRRWRYNAYAGRPSAVLDTGRTVDGGPLLGGVVNYLVHPRAVAGASLETQGDRYDASVSLDWNPGDRLAAYAGLYHSSIAGRGVEAQAMFNHAKGSILLGHAHRTGTATGHDDAHADWQSRSALTWNHRLGLEGNLSARLTHVRGSQAGTGVDAGYSHVQQLFGERANWRVSLYDRPAVHGLGTSRDRGIDFTFSIALGTQGRHYSGSLGSRTSTRGRRDLYASAGVQQVLDWHGLQYARADASVDRHGLGLDAGAGFSRPWLAGDAQVQRGSGDGRLGGSLNLASNIALGEGRLAIVGQEQAQAISTGAGVIIDVRSDDPDTLLSAYDSHGTSVKLRPGRNFVPVSAYRPGQLQLDFAGAAAPSATLQPATVDYHLNKGGVAHATVDVSSTFTVMGQVVDGEGRGLRGVHVLNPAGRSVSQDEGFFALDVTVRSPDLELQQPGSAGCRIPLDPQQYRKEGDVLMVGRIACPAPSASAGR